MDIDKEELLSFLKQAITDECHSQSSVEWLTKAYDNHKICGDSSINDIVIHRIIIDLYSRLSQRITAEEIRKEYSFFIDVIEGRMAFSCSFWMLMSKCVDRAFCNSVAVILQKFRDGVEIDDLVPEWEECAGRLSPEHTVEQTVGMLILREIRCLQQMIIHRTPILDCSCINVDWRTPRLRQVVSRIKKLLKVAEGKAQFRLSVQVEGESSIVLFIV